MDYGSVSPELATLVAEEPEPEELEQEEEEEEEQLIPVGGFLASKQSTPSTSGENCSGSLRGDASKKIPTAVSEPALQGRRMERLKKRTSLQRKNRYSINKNGPHSTGNIENPSQSQNNHALPYSYSVPSFLELASRNGISNDGTITSPNGKRPQSILIFGNRKGDMSKVKAGTLDQLIAFMVDGRDHVYIETLIATHSYFVNSETLLTRLMEKFYDGERIEVLEVLRIWIDFYWDDFKEENLMFFNMFLSDLRSKSENIQKKAVELFDMLNRKHQVHTLLDHFGRSESVLSLREIPMLAPIETRISGLTPTSYTPIQIATRLTMIENEMYKDIPLREYLFTAWNQKTTKDGKTNPQGARLRALIERSNNVSYWVATSILTVGHDNKPRKNMVALFVDAACSCLELQNFQSAMQIYTALNLTPISRLPAWKSLAKKTQSRWDSIVEFFNPTGNFKNYRSRLAAARPPAIPLLSLILSDLTMIEENKNLIHLEEEGEVIHFEKMSMIYDTLSVLKRLLSLTPPLRSPRSPSASNASNDPLLVMLNVLPHLSESELYEFKGDQDKIKVKQLLKEWKELTKQKKKGSKIK